MRHLFYLPALLMAIPLFGQNLTPLFHGTKSLAIGNASVNLTGIYSSYSNPSGLSTLNSFSANINVENKFEIPELTTAQISLAKPIEKFGVLGISLTSFGIKEYNDQKLSLAYAKRLFKSLSLGIQFDWLQTRIKEYGTINRFTFELGMQAQIDKNLKLGVHLFSPYGLHYTEGIKIPSIFSIGLSYKASKQVILHGQVEKHQDYPFQIKFGILYQVIPQFSLSFGLFTESEAANISGGFSYLFKDIFTIDTAVSYNQLLGISSGIGVSISR